MAHVRADRALETSTSTGTGNIALAGAVTGFAAFATYLSDGDTFDYVIYAADGNGVPTGAWETGVGAYVSSGNQFSRSVRQSSNSGSLVDFAAGTKRVAMTITASEVRQLERRATATESSASTNLQNSAQRVYTRYTNTGAKTLTVRPQSAHAIDQDAEFAIANRAATGALTIVAGSGVTINVPAGGTLVLNPGMVATLKRVAENEFDLIGQVVPA